MKETWMKTNITTHSTYLTGEHMSSVVLYTLVLIALNYNYRSF